MAMRRVIRWRRKIAPRMTEKTSVRLSNGDSALPLARSRARLLRLAGAWVLAGGLLVALYRVFEWWRGGAG